MTYYTIEQSPYSPKGEYTLMSTELITSHFHPAIPYSLLPAKVMNLTYASYLRMCRDVYGARLSGKSHRFVVPYFPTKESAEPLAGELNRRLTYYYKELLKRS